MKTLLVGRDLASSSQSHSVSSALKSQESVLVAACECIGPLRLAAAEPLGRSYSVGPISLRSEVLAGL